MIAWIIAIIGFVIGVIGIIFTNIATKFNPFNTTPFSKYTFANLCYDLENVWMYCICVGFGIFGGICFGKFL